MFDDAPTAQAVRDMNHSELNRFIDQLQDRIATNDLERMDDGQVFNCVRASLFHVMKILFSYI